MKIRSAMLLACMGFAQALRLHHESESWASGCSSIYVDIGSNVGVQIRKLFEPSKYPGSTILREFDNLFGLPEIRTKASNETKLCAIGFEANPQMVDRLQTIEKAYNANGWKVKFMVPFAVSDVDNKDVTFFVDGDTGVNQWGSSIMNWQGPNGLNPRHRKNMSAVNVKTLDMARFLEKEIFSVNPKTVVMKMDIEGSEFIVLPELIRRGHLCREHVTKIYIEWHNRFQPNGTTAKEQLMYDIGNQTCQSGKSPISGLDDESYRQDGQPLPGTEAPKELHKANSLLENNGKDVTRAIYDAVQKEWATRQK